MYTDSRLTDAPLAHQVNGAAREVFGRARTVFNDGESLWIPLMILGIGYAVVVPVFLLVLALDAAAAALWG